MYRVRGGELLVLNTLLAEPVRPGELSVAPGNAARPDRAIAGCLEGRRQPYDRANAVRDDGCRLRISGHTVHLAQRSGVDDVVMMLATDAMRVALATTHYLYKPCRRVDATVTGGRLRILHHAMQGQFGLATPRLVCGLNPHAGESGHTGREE